MSLKNIQRFLPKQIEKKCVKIFFLFRHNFICFYIRASIYFLKITHKIFSNFNLIYSNASLFSNKKICTPTDLCTSFLQNNPIFFLSMRIAPPQLSDNRDDLDYWISKNKSLSNLVEYKNNRVRQQKEPITFDPKRPTTHTGYILANFISFQFLHPTPLYFLSLLHWLHIEKCKSKSPPIVSSPPFFRKKNKNIFLPAQQAMPFLVPTNRKPTINRMFAFILTFYSSDWPRKCSIQQIPSSTSTHTRWGRESR